MPPAFDEIVGVRFPGRQSLVWFRSGQLVAEPGTWVVADQNGASAVGQIVVGRGQCLAFPSDPATLPELVREARPEEKPTQRGGSARALLDSLP